MGVIITGIVTAVAVASVGTYVVAKAVMNNRNHGGGPPIVQATATPTRPDPSLTVKAFYTDALVTYDAPDGYKLICTDVRAGLSESQFQTEITQIQQSGYVLNISGLTYTTHDRSATVAHVIIGGTISATYLGQTVSAPVTPINDGQNDIILHPQGSAWCIYGATSSNGGGTTTI